MTESNVFRIETGLDGKRLESSLQDLIQEQREIKKVLLDISNSLNRPELLSHQEAAEFLGVAPGTLYNHVLEKRVRRYKIGKKRNVYKRSELQAAIDIQMLEQDS